MAAAAGPSPFGANNSAGPAFSGFAITPSDTTNFNSMCRSIYVGGAGNIVVIMSDGTSLTFVGCPAGLLLPVVAIRVNNTNTTATNLIGLV